MKSDLFTYMQRSLTGVFTAMAHIATTGLEERISTYMKSSIDLGNRVVKYDSKLTDIRNEITKIY